MTGIGRDQRDVLRASGVGASGTACDVGAYEYDAATAGLPGATIVVDGVTCTLADAITAANTNQAVGACASGVGSDVIDLRSDVTLKVVDNEVYGATGLPVVIRNLTIVGNHHKIERAGSAPDFRILAVGSGADLTLQSATLSGGKVTGSGGGIFSKSGVLALTDSDLSGNSAWNGGGVYAVGGTLTVLRSTLSGNTADTGGGIHAAGGAATILKSTVSGNSAQSGGGVYTLYGALTVSNSTISHCGAGRDGGGIDARTGTLAVENSILSGNSAGLVGGGIHAIRTTAVVSGSSLSGNTANYRGGGIAAEGGTLSVLASAIEGNSASRDGGGIEALITTLTVHNGSLSGNSAGQAGGAIDVLGSTARVINSTLSGNAAQSGAGMVARAYVYCYDTCATPVPADVQVTNSTLSSNLATGKGGGVLVEGAALVTLTSITLSGNSAGQGAGLSMDEKSSVAVQSSILALQQGGDCDVVGALTSNGHNIESGASCHFTGPGDQHNVTGDHLKLGPLKDNGGPTDTMALAAGSIAIDRIPAAVGGCAPGLSEDQRGYARSNGPGSGGAACDVGAFEYDSSPLARLSTWLPWLRR